MNKITAPSIPAISLAAIAPLMAGCSLNVKTPTLPNFPALEDAELEATSRTDFEILMGAPQSRGQHLVDEFAFKMTFYYGLMGVMTVLPSQSAKLNSGMAFASFNEEDELSELIYFESRFDGPKIQMGGKLSIRDVANSIQPGVTAISELTSILGEPSYEGRRFNKAHGIEHTIAFFDTSAVSGSSVVKERWLLAGYDEQSIIQDLFWVSSHASDLKALGDIQETNFKNMTRMDYGYPYSVARTNSVATSNKIDPVQVEALLRSNLKTIDEYTEILGLPTARGFKTFLEHDPLVVSQWSYMATDILGNERNPSLKPQKNNNGSPRQVGYVVLDIKTTRLMIAHSPEGAVAEVIWFSPGDAAP